MMIEDGMSSGSTNTIVMASAVVIWPEARVVIVLIRSRLLAVVIKALSRCYRTARGRLLDLDLDLDLGYRLPSDAPLPAATRRCWSPDAALLLPARSPTSRTRAAR